MLYNNLRKLNEQHKLHNESPPQLINVATLPCKIKSSPGRYTTTPTRSSATGERQRTHVFLGSLADRALHWTSVAQL